MSQFDNGIKTRWPELKGVGENVFNLKSHSHRHHNSESTWQNFSNLQPLSFPVNVTFLLHRHMSLSRSFCTLVSLPRFVPLQFVSHDLKFPHFLLPILLPSEKNILAEVCPHPFQDFRQERLPPSSTFTALTSLSRSFILARGRERAMEEKGEPAKERGNAGAILRNP